MTSTPLNEHTLPTTFPMIVSGTMSPYLKKNNITVTRHPRMIISTHNPPSRVEINTLKLPSRVGINTKNPPSRVDINTLISPVSGGNPHHQATPGGINMHYRFTLAWKVTKVYLIDMGRLIALSLCMFIYFSSIYIYIYLHVCSQYTVCAFFYFSFFYLFRYEQHDHLDP